MKAAMEMSDLKYCCLWVERGWPEIPSAANTVLPVCMPTKQEKTLKATESMRPEVKKHSMRMMLVNGLRNSWLK